MKKWIALLLCLGMLAGLSGCSLFAKEQMPVEDFEIADRMQTDHDTVGVILEDAVPCYSDRNDLYNTRLGVLSRGERVNIYYREISGSGNWVFTDRGWIDGTYVQTQPGGNGGNMSVVIVQKQNNCRTAQEVQCREYPNYNANVTATYYDGQQLYIDALIPGQDGMWGATADGWVPMCDVIMDDVGARGAVSMEVIAKVTQRAGPGVEYDAMGVSALGPVPITNLADSHGILWGQVDGRIWICLDFVQLPGTMKLLTSENEIFEPDRYRDPAAYTGQGSQGNQGNQGSQGNQGTMTQVPNNTPLVGIWSRFDEDEFLRHGWVSGEGWRFNSDGSFSFGGCEYMYFPDRGGWYGASGGWGSEGIFTYDGTELKLQINAYYDPDPDAPVDNTVEYRSYACTVDGNKAYWDGSFYRTEDVNEAVRDCVRRRAAAQVDSNLVAVWTGDNGDRLELRDDGSFTDSRGSGVYLSSHGRVYLVYSDGFIGLLEAMQEPTLERDYVEDGYIYTAIYTRSN